MKEGDENMELDTQDYYRDLSHLQNHDDCAYIDIMTITGFMSPSEKIKHLLRYAQYQKDTELIEKWKTQLVHFELAG